MTVGVHTESLGWPIYEALLLDVPVISVQRDYMDNLFVQFPFLVSRIAVIDQDSCLDDGFVSSVVADFRPLNSRERVIVKQGNDYEFIR
jgi:hypothetical protein